VGEAVRAEDPRGEEAVDQGDQAVLADVLAFAVADCLGRTVAIGGSVAAGVIGRLAFAGAALHSQRGRSGRCPQQVGTFLRATTATAVAVAAALHLRLGALELLVGDQGLVALICFDPFLGAAPSPRPGTLLVGA